MTNYVACTSIPGVPAIPWICNPESATIDYVLIYLFVY